MHKGLDIIVRKFRILLFLNHLFIFQLLLLVTGLLQKSVPLRKHAIQLK